MLKISMEVLFQDLPGFPAFLKVSFQIFVEKFAKCQFRSFRTSSLDEIFAIGNCRVEGASFSPSLSEPLSLPPVSLHPTVPARPDCRSLHL